MRRARCSGPSWRTRQRMQACRGFRCGVVRRAAVVVLTLWPLVPRWARVVLALYPPAMAFALVYTAEHYLVDVLLGWAYTVVALWIVDRAGTAWARAARPRREASA